MQTPHRVGLLLFDGFELLDVFGPVELFSRLPNEYPITFVGTRTGPVRSSQGAEVIATDSIHTAVAPDIAMVPGGMGTRDIVTDASLLGTIAEWAGPAQYVTSVCTGSAVLAAAGLLEGHKATSNKLAFAWAASHGQDVSWMPKARWVQDGNRWTSSGVAAGMDMTAALIAHLSGAEASAKAAREIELEVHTDADWDPFAAIHDPANRPA